MANAIENKDQNDGEDFVDELQPGTKLLHGQYTIESFLNSGGFGITYLARDSLDRRVVIKECFPGALCRRGASRVGARSRAHQSEFKSVVESFVQEAHSMAKLKHPNIVGVHQVFEDNDTAYMALDFIDGFDLLDNIEEGKGDLSPDDISRILRKLLGAVGFIHDQSILHRDISPDNILIDKKTGEPLLIDFGAAREEVAKSSRVLSALRVVKDGYSPQEFYINGSKQGPSSDLYALAASFYHMISGEAPPNSQMRLSALAQDEGDSFEPLADKAKYQKDYDIAFLSAIDKALNVFPKDRIQSAEEWLALISSNVSDIAPKVAEPEKVAKTKKKEPKVIANESKPPKKSNGMLLAVCFVALTGGVGYYAWDAGMLDSKGEAEPPIKVATVDPTPAVKPAIVAQPEAGTVDVSPIGPDETAQGGQENPDVVVMVDPPSQNPTPAPPAENTTQTPPVVPGTDTPTLESATQDTEVNTPVAEAPDPAPAEPVADVIPSVTVETVVHLPFSNKAPFSDKIGPKRTIAKLDELAPSWLQVGYSVIAVNGQSIESLDEISSILSKNADIAGVNTITAVLLIEAFPGANTIPKEVTLDVSHEITLSSGLKFRLQEADGGAVNTVVTESNEPAGGMKVGDILVGYMATQERIGPDISLQDLLRREIAKGVANYSMVVTRNGEQRFAPFALNIEN